MNIEILEARIAPASHEWTGLGATNLWSDSANWTNGSPATDFSGDIDLIFHTNLASPGQLVMENDILGLLVDSITFDAAAGTNAAGGTSANGYTINGNTITINTGAAGQDPLGINITAGVADPASGITQTFNTAIVLVTTDATFQIQDTRAILDFNGNVILGGRTLTLNNPNHPNGAIGMTMDGAISNGSLIKNGTGQLQLTGDNSFTDLTANSGRIFADTDTALGTSAGTITVNDPAQIKLRGGVTVEKTTLNLNSNTSGGGLGVDGNTTNTFRGSVVLMAGNSGVALGAGNGAANAGARLVIDGAISGATSTLFLNGAGTIEFTRDNSYTGITQINGNQGFTAVQINSPDGLGASGDANRLIMNNGGGGQPGGALLLNFDGELAEDIDFAGSGIGASGAIRVLDGQGARLTGNITFIAAAPWTFAAGDGDTLTTEGVIDSQGANRALSKIGDGTLVIGGTAANVWQGGVIVSDGKLAVTNPSATPLGTLAGPSGGLVTVGQSVLEVASTANVPNPIQLNAGGTLAGAGTVAQVTSAGGIISPGTSAGRLTAGNVTLDANSQFLADINGSAAGTGYDQLVVDGTVDLGGAILLLAGGFAAAPGAELRLIDNDGADAVTGTFAGLAEGATVASGGSFFTISYTGGTGNDVVLTAIPPVSDLAIAANGRSATFTDVDGDLVTVKITKGTLAADDFVFRFTGENRQQLQRLDFDAGDANTNVTITAKRTAAGGDGFTNVGFLSAAGVALGTLKVDGDLGRVVAGEVKSLTVQSLGALGLTSQEAGGSLVSEFAGKLGKLTVKASIHGATVLGSGSIGAVSVLGSFHGGQLSAGADLGSVSIRGDIVGTEDAPVIISGFGKEAAPAKGPDTAIKSLKVTGGVEFLRLLGGFDTALAGLNADAAIGAISVGGDWRASSVQAGAQAGADGFAGTADDVKLAGGGVRDEATIFSSIASVTIKGQAFGSTGAGDTFGIVAELIGKAKVGKAAFKFDQGERDPGDVFALATTGPGATGLASDFFIREIAL